MLEGPELEKYRVFKDLHYVGRISGCEDFIIVDKEKGAIEPNLTPSSYESIMRRSLDKNSFSDFLNQVPLAIKKISTL